LNNYKVGITNLSKGTKHLFTNDGMRICDNKKEVYIEPKIKEATCKKCLKKIEVS